MMRGNRHSKEKKTGMYSQALANEYYVNIDHVTIFVFLVRRNEHYLYPKAIILIIMRMLYFIERKEQLHSIFFMHIYRKKYTANLKKLVTLDGIIIERHSD
jgi:hypothetical protein